MAEWPSDLPQKPLYQQYQEQAPSLVVRTSMEIGPAKVRKRFTAGVRPFKLRFQFTDDELALFDEFFLVTVNGGATSFDWTHPRTDELGTYRFVVPPPPVYTQLGPGLWIVDCQVELLP